MFSVATVFLLLASLVAAAGFAVVAQRRLRQLGMLAAVGATQKHLRLVLLANGALVGHDRRTRRDDRRPRAWVAFAPTLESAVDHRIDRLSLPWWLVAPTVLLAILGATAAAWWPGRTLARLPVVLALSGRPPRPRPARHSAIAAAALIAVGVGLSRTLGPRPAAAHRRRDRGDDPRLPSPRPAGDPHLLPPRPDTSPIAPRLALRDLVRYQARSGAALAAVTLALGIAAAVVVIAAAEEKRQNERAAASRRTCPTAKSACTLVPPRPGRHPDPDPDAAPSSRARGAASANSPPVSTRQPSIPLRKAIQPGAAAQGHRGRPGPSSPSVSRGRPARTPGPGNRSSTSRTPALLRHLGIDPATVDPSADFLADAAVPTDELVIPSMRARRQFAAHERPEDRGRPSTCSDPASDTGKARPSFITLERSSPPRLEADPGRLARRVEPAADERPDRRRPRRVAADAGLDDRGRAREHLLRDGHGDRDRRRRAPGARASSR